MSWWKRKTKKLLRPTRVRAAAHRWGWWFSSDEENYSGPYATRDAAIAAARSEHCGEFDRVEGVGRFYLLEARQGPIALWRYVDSSDVMENVCQAVDDDYGGEDGIEWDGAWPDAADARLELWLRRLVRFWQWWHGIKVRTWGFTHSRNAERYTWVRGF